MTDGDQSAPDEPVTVTMPVGWYYPVDGADENMPNSDRQAKAKADAEELVRQCLAEQGGDPDHARVEFVTFDDRPAAPDGTPALYCTGTTRRW